MKYLRTYEDLEDKGFWYIPYNNEEYILMSIKKLPIPEKIIDNIYTLIFDFFLKPDSLDRVKNGIFVNYNAHKTCSFWPCSNESGFRKAMIYYKEENFKGKIKLEDFEINAKKYNL